MFGTVWYTVNIVGSTALKPFLSEWERCTLWVDKIFNPVLTHMSSIMVMNTLLYDNDFPLPLTVGRLIKTEDVLRAIEKLGDIPRLIGTQRHGCKGILCAVISIITHLSITWDITEMKRTETVRKVVKDRRFVLDFLKKLSMGQM